MIVEAGKPLATVLVQDRLRAEIDRRIKKLLDQETQNIRIDQRRDLIAELELVQHLLDVWRKAVEIGFEIRLQLLTAGL